MWIRVKKNGGLKMTHFYYSNNIFFGVQNALSFIDWFRVWIFFPDNDNQFQLSIQHFWIPPIHTIFSTIKLCTTNFFSCMNAYSKLSLNQQTTTTITTKRIKVMLRLCASPSNTNIKIFITIKKQQQQQPICLVHFILYTHK